MMVQKSTPEEIFLRHRSAVSVLSLGDAKLYEEASESSHEDDNDSSDVKADEEDERLQGVQEQDNTADEVDLREDNLEGDDDVDGDVDGKADDEDTGGHQGAQYAYSDYDDDATEALPLQKIVSVYELKHRVPTNPNLGSASESAPEKEVDAQSPIGKGENGEDGNELDSAQEEYAESQSATQNKEGRDDDVVEESNEPIVNETDVVASLDLGTISRKFPPTCPPSSSRSVHHEECDDESVCESVEVVLDDVPVGKSVRSRGVILLPLPRGKSSETEKNNESKKPEKKERMTAPDAQSKGSSPDDEFGNMVDSPALLMRKSRSAHVVVWQYPLVKIYLGQNQGPKASEDLVLDNSDTKASTIQKKLNSEKESSNAMKPDPAPTKKIRDQSKDSIFRNIDSRSSSGTSGLSNSTSATEVTERAGNRTFGTFHPFGVSSESEKERSVLKNCKIKTKKIKKVKKMTQGLGKDNSEDSRIATITTIEEKPAARSRKHTSIQLSKDRKSRFTLKMW